MASKLGVIVADFSTSLATAMAVGATTVSIQSATDDDGVALPAGLYYFAIDGNNSSKEHIQATLSGTSLTGIQSVSRQGVLTSGCVRSHRVGATVTLTDFAHIKYINDLVKGATTFDATAPLGYDGTASITTSNQLATKAYVDGVAIAGAPDSSTTVKGIVKMSVAPASPTSPIAVGDNDTRIPSASQALALAGNGGTPSGSNLFVTVQGLPSTVNFGDGSDGDATISGSTTLTRDMYYNNLTVTGTLTTDGYKVYVKGTLSGNGTIKAPDGNAGGNATTATGGSAPALVGTGPLRGVAGVAGVNGANSVGAVGNAGSSGTIGAVGVAGGAGGNESSGPRAGGVGGAGGTIISAATKLVERWMVNTFCYRTTSGISPHVLNGTGSGGAGAGNGGTGGGGGASGSSGGIVWLAVNIWSGTVTIRAVGGTGGNGGNGVATLGGGGGGGAGGNGGIAIVIYGTKTWTGAYTLTGGTGGTGGTHVGATASDGASGTNGATGSSFEIQITTLL